MEALFAEAFTSYEASHKTAEAEVTFYSSQAYQSYYEHHFNESYKEYSSYTFEELEEEEELLNELRQKSVGLLMQIKQKNKGLGLNEYKLCCELDAELDAVHAAYRRRIRSKSI